jgi:signal transduction histidine kinase/ligand-binding sensor domain-containing protein
MTSPRPFYFLSILLILALVAIVVFSQSEPIPEVSLSNPTENYEKTADDAALNLHRWGAVTLFHGLPSDRVNAITEDGNGALWFGTDNGLVRYDGRRTQAVGSVSTGGDYRGVLPSQRIRALFRDSAGGLWIGTEQGAARLVREKLVLLEATRNRAVTAFAESPQHEILVVTEQGQIIRLQNTLSEIKRANEPFAEEISAQVIDGQTQSLLSIDNHSVALKAIAFHAATNEWWLASHRRGVLKLSTKAQPVSLVEAISPPTRPYFVNAIFSEGGNLWLGAQAGTNDSGLWWQKANQSFSKLPLVTGTVTALHGHNKGDDLWVGTEGQGALLLRGGNVIERLTFESTKGGLRSNRIYSVYRDREGIVWFGTERGVCRYDRDSFRTTTLSNDAQSNFIRALLTTKDGVTFAGTNRGLYRLEAGFELGGWTQLLGIGTNAVFALLEASDGKVYAGTAAGLFVAPPGSSAFRLVPAESGGIRALTEFAGNIYAIIFERGLAKLEGDKLQLFITDAPARQATCIAASEDEKILRVGTKAGQLLIVEPTKLRPEVNPLPGVVRSLMADQGKLWIGHEKGLFVVENNAQRTVLPAVDVQSLILTSEGEDKHPVLFCATKSAGLYKIRPDSGAMIRFDTEQGLPSQQVFATTKGANGEIWIGTNRGIVRHQPNLTPPILEPRRMVADNIYTPDYLTTEMRFPAYQKNYLFEFAGLGSKTFPSQFQYEYTLTEEKRGVINQFITSDSQFQLTGMDTGQYTITARAISRDLIYSAPFQFRLWISPEAISWTTIWLTGLLIVAIGAGGYAFYQQRRTAKANQKLAITNEELRETRIRLEHNTETERSRIARDLHDQTLADLRQLLVMTDQLDRPLANAQSPTPAAMRRKIEEVSNEIRHICEDLSPSVLENIGFVPALEWALTAAVTHLPADVKFAYEFQCEADLEDRLQLTPPEQIQLYRIVQEAINNVCRHAQARKVTLRVHITNDNELVIEVIDDGIGLPDKVENPTGHGMANIRSRANLIGAEVTWLETRQGCHFEVRKKNATAK